MKQVSDEQSLITALREDKDIQLTSDITITQLFEPLNYSSNLNGNGYTIKNPLNPLVQANTGTIQNIQISDSEFKNLSTDEEIGCVCNVNKGEIKNVTINSGLFEIEGVKFGCIAGVSSEGIIKGCAVERAEIYAQDAKSIGSLVGFCVEDSLIKDCESTANINATESEKCGGIVGQLFKQSTIKSCKFKGEITGKRMIGGIVGETKLAGVYNCENLARVDGNKNIGGIAGWLVSTIKNCVNTGKITGDEEVGGIAGVSCAKSEYPVENHGVVKGREKVGGIFGYANCKLFRSKNTGDISGRKIVGGLIGESKDTVQYSYSEGSVSGQDSVGGIVGRIVSEIKVEFQFKQVYSLVKLDGVTFTGPIIGKDNTENGSLLKCTNVYWDIPEIQNSKYGKESNLCEEGINALITL